MNDASGDYDHRPGFFAADQHREDADDAARRSREFTGVPCDPADIERASRDAMQQTFDGREVPHDDVVRETKGSGRRTRAKRAVQNVPDAARDAAKHAASHAEKGRS